MSGLKYWLWLSERRGLPLRVKLSLLERFGSPEDVFYADAEEYLLVEGVSRAQAEALSDKSLAEADEILGACDRLDARILTLQDADYPVRLRNIYEPPMLLYVRGRLPLFDEEAAVAVVGTRSASPYGISAAERICTELAKQGALVVSGAAEGIDSAAHRGALRGGGRTAAVLGCGVDVVYPRENRWLYEDILAAGALISEYPPGTPAVGAHFPVRNRIISGLCLATLVVEAGERSGALITAHTALEQGRDVFAVPGPIDAAASRGCNRLIAESEAGLVMESWDILREYEARYPHCIHREHAELPRTYGYRARREAEETGAAGKPKDTENAEQQRALAKLDLRTAKDLTDDQLAVLRALAEGELQSDDLIERTGLPTRRVLSALTVLEIEERVTQRPGKYFSLNVELIEE